MSEKFIRERNKILLSVILYLAILIVEKTGILPFLPEHSLWYLPLYLIPYFLSGLSVVKECFLGIKNRRPFDEALLMTVATLGAFLSGEFAEAVAVMVFYQVGELFQSYAVGKSRKSIKELMDIVPELAHIEREDGTVDTVDPDEVEVGDMLLIKPGERVPVDGIVRQGESMVNTAALTGESVPREVFPGEKIISGCINGEGMLRVEALKAFEDSTVSKILELVEEASEKKSKAENFITKFARIYTPIVVYAALALAVLPSLGLFLGTKMGLVSPEFFAAHPPLTWLYRACTFLVVSCPCALVISVPLSFFGGIGAASREGVLVKGSNYLELVSKLKVVVSDKTGTLTKGNFAVQEIEPFEGISKEELLRTAAMAENGSTHPIGLSILNAYKKWTEDSSMDRTSQDDAVAESNSAKNSSEGSNSLPFPENTENRSGAGLISIVEGCKILVGKAKLLEEEGISVPKQEEGAATICLVAKDGQYLGRILIADEVKESSKEAVSKMKLQGIENVVMLTGDSIPVAEAVGRELCLDSVYGELLPAQKVEKVEEILSSLSGEGEKRSGYLAFIGDGINDAPVLSRADVGIAMGAMGSDAAIEAADVVIMDDDLSRIPTLIAIGKKTMTIAMQNIVFALAVKFLVLILSAVGIANMWAAVFGDVGVTVICIINAMRLMQNPKSI
ncbi:heavy metal translocating P-type ATPase [Oribacterium sp.]